MKFLHFSILLLSLGCSTSSKKGSVRGEVPEWVYSPMADCREQFEMCASGEGESLFLADLNARKSMAAIFETEVSSELTSSASEAGVVGVSEVELKQDISRQVTEKVNMVLEGVTIKQRHNQDGVFFALAHLDKQKAWNKLKKEIKDVDEQLVEYKKRKRRSTLKKMYALYDLRSQLNERFAFLRGKGLAQKVTLADIKEIHYGLSTTAKKIKFNVENKITDSQVEFLETMLSGYGHKIVDGSADFDINLTGEVKQRQEYMNVKGFKKYSFEIYLVTQKPNGTKIGGLSLKQTAIGRSQKDAYAKVEGKIKEYIEEHIDELNID